MGKCVDFIAWSDCAHLRPPIMSQEEIDAAYAKLPPHMREARSKGIPSIGSGAIYPVRDDDLLCEPFPIPPFWGMAYGLDVGWRVTAAIWLAHDPEHDVMYLTHEYYGREAAPALHAAAIHAISPYPLCGALDPAAEAANQVDGRRLAHEYRKLGLELRLANNAVEAGIHACLTRMQSGRLKVFNTCTHWFQEKRIYRRKGELARGVALESDAAMAKVVRLHNHLMDATRYAVYTPGLLRQHPSVEQGPTDFAGRRVGGEF